MATIKSGNTLENKKRDEALKNLGLNKTASQDASSVSTNGTSQNNLKGVDDATRQKLTSEFVESETSKNLTANAEGAYNRYNNYIQKDMISPSTERAMNKNFKVPSAVTEADIYLAQQLEKIQSGKTSYSDQVRDMMDKIMNRDKFSYDVDKDPLFQQALASAMNSGKQAMQDTMGQASALTGGYGSTYATTAGNQAYNAYIEDAYDNLPQYYQMALDAYNAEGDEMYRQYGMLSDADDKEYNRNVTAYDATYQHRNQLYNEAYTQYRDKKADAFAEANLEMQEYAQKSADYYNLYSMASDMADRQYEREYNSWADSIKQTMQYAQLLNSDAWSQANFDEDVRRFNADEYYRWADFNQKEYQFDTTREQSERFHQDEVSLERDKMALEDKWKQQDIDLAYAQLKQLGGSGGGGGGGRSGGGSGGSTTVVDPSMANSPGVQQFKSSMLTYEEFQRRGNQASVNGKTKRYDNYNQYIDDKLYYYGKEGTITEKERDYLIEYYFTK